MTSITAEGITEWASQDGMFVTADRVLSLTYQSPAPQTRVTILTDTERTPGDLVLLANRLVWASSDGDEAPFINNVFRAPSNGFSFVWSWFDNFMYGLIHDVLNWFWGTLPNVIVYAANDPATQDMRRK